MTRAMIPIRPRKFTSRAYIFVPGCGVPAAHVVAIDYRGRMPWHAGVEVDQEMVDAIHGALL